MELLVELAEGEATKFFLKKIFVGTGHVIVAALH